MLFIRQYQPQEQHHQKVVNFGFETIAKWAIFIPYIINIWNHLEDQPERFKNHDTFCFLVTLFFALSWETPYFGQKA